MIKKKEESRRIPQDICILLPVEKINLQSRETISQSTAYAGVPPRFRACARYERAAEEKSKKGRKKKWRTQRIACHEVGWSGAIATPYGSTGGALFTPARIAATLA